MAGGKVLRLKAEGGEIVNRELGIGDGGLKD